MLSLHTIRIGWYLAVRQLRRANFWTTSLIIFVMLLTFLNLVIVTGILVGIVQGINASYLAQEFGDVAISAGQDKNYIEGSANLLSVIQASPQVESVSARYITGGSAEANYKTQTNPNNKSNKVGVTIVGINPVAEDRFSDLSSRITLGQYLAPGDYDKVLVGWYLLSQYQSSTASGENNLQNVGIGTKLRLTVNGAGSSSIEREVTVKGIIKSKIQEIGTSIYMDDGELRTLLKRNDYNVGQIVIRLQPGYDSIGFRDMLKHYAMPDTKVQTFAEGIPSGVADIQNTFSLLGNGLSSIGLIVAAITIFIVVFINAITRRKFIGILRGIGISGEAIELSYMFQSLFYAICGSAIGLVIIYGFMVPYFLSHPIDFPFGDGILVASVPGTLFRVGLLVFATVIAGYLPSRMIVRKNILDSILGRN
jgi:ABC-type lipoprotein release transport system permease subunit